MKKSSVLKTPNNILPLAADSSLGQARPGLAPNAEASADTTQPSLQVVLTSNPKEALSQCEVVIAKGWDTFLEVGRALATIQNQKLYLEAGFTSFRQYYENRWGYGRSYVSRLISAKEVVEGLLTIGNIPVLPKNEAQVRPLIGLAPETAKEVWLQSIATANGGEITAKVVETTAASFSVSRSTKNTSIQPLVRIKKKSNPWYRMWAQLDSAKQLLQDPEHKPAKKLLNEMETSLSDICRGIHRKMKKRPQPSSSTTEQLTLF